MRRITLLTCIGWLIFSYASLHATDLDDVTKMINSGKYAEAEAFAAIVTRHPQVRRLICGHVHCPTIRNWAGTTASIMPSVAVDVRKGMDEDALRQRPIYWLHEIDDEGDVSTRARVVPAQ